MSARHEAHPLPLMLVPLEQKGEHDEHQPQHFN
jgi:hypothetical protein